MSPTPNTYRHTKHTGQASAQSLVPKPTPTPGKHLSHRFRPCASKDARWVVKRYKVQRKVPPRSHLAATRAASGYLQHRSPNARIKLASLTARLCCWCCCSCWECVNPAPALGSPTTAALSPPRFPAAKSLTYSCNAATGLWRARSCFLTWVRGQTSSGGGNTAVGSAAGSTGKTASRLPSRLTRPDRASTAAR